MPIEEIDLTIERKKLPEKVKNYLREANHRIDEFFETEKNRKVPRFIPCNDELLYHWLSAINDSDLCLGKVYCEWGSGYGVGTCLASLLGYESYGIEIEPSLIEASRKLAEDSNISVTIIERDYMPEGFECYEGSGGAELIRPENYTYQERSELRPGYEGMDADLDEVDIFFIYPWPGEQEFVLEFFQAVAADGTLCLIYLGDGEFGLYQKTADPFD
ncbi:MAG TPA: class I SAM-dependent methyltransferase [Verrucomicrobia bacterium]|nr:class I SAM-dependent methyltransferase [Verrucomicrobiales bacterium]HIL55598.1 class I SAM-dependent methyltransferase [Verrucomicrobiota bacterium]